MLFLGYWSVWFLIFLVLFLTKKVTIKENWFFVMLFFSFLLSVPTTLIHMTFSDIRIFLAIAAAAAVWLFLRRKKRGRRV